MAARRADPGQRQVRQVGRVGGEQRAEQGYEGRDPDDDRRCDPGRAGSAQQPHGPRAARGGPDGDRDGRAHWARLPRTTRGSSTAYITSTSKLTRTNAVTSTSEIPCTTARSFDCADCTR